MVFYQAIFHKENNGYWVSFPDFPGCFSQGNDLSDTFMYAQEALQLCIMDKLKNNETLPTPTLTNKLNDEDSCVLVSCDTNKLAA